MKLVQISATEYKLTLDDGEVPAISALGTTDFGLILQHIIQERIRHHNATVREELLANLEHISLEDSIHLRNIMEKGRANRVRIESERSSRNVGPEGSADVSSSKATG